MLTLFVSGAIVIGFMLLAREDRNSRHSHIEDKTAPHDTTGVFEREKQKRIRQMARWGISW